MKLNNIKENKSVYIKAKTENIVNVNVKYISQTCTT